jgi:hypothetical protein
VQVEQRQHLSDLRGLPAPGRQDLRGEPLAFAGGGIDALVVHPGSPHLDRAGGGHRPLPVVAVADHQTAAGLVAPVSQLGYVLVDLGLQSGGEHPPHPLMDDVVHQGAALGGAVVADYAEHGRAFPTRAATRANSVTC